MLLINQNKPAEAEQLFREVIRDGGPAIGAGHPTVLSATRNLGDLLLGQKRYAEAAELLSAAEPAARKSYTGTSERLLGRGSWRNWAGHAPGWGSLHPPNPI